MAGPRCGGRRVHRGRRRERPGMARGGDGGWGVVVVGRVMRRCKGGMGGYRDEDEDEEP